MKKIAVLGGGGTGCTMAADLTIRGYQVALYEDSKYWENIAGIQKRGSIEMTGQATVGEAVIDCITSDLEVAVQDAQVILVAIIATRHQELVRALAPLLADGQTVCFSAGNCASLLLRKEIGEDRDVIVGEMQGNIYPCRLTKEAEVSCALPYIQKKVAAFPGRDTTRLIEAMGEIYQCVPAKNILEATFNSPNISIHLAGSLLNACAIEKNPDFRMYQDGISESVLTCIAAVEKEKTLVMDVMGYENAAHFGMMKKISERDQHRELDDFRKVAGPSSMKHRYIEEDASTGQALMISLAHMLGIQLPCMEALVTLASVINEKDYMGTGRTIESFGMGGMTPGQINQFLETGSDNWSEEVTMRE